MLKWLKTENLNSHERAIRRTTIFVSIVLAIMCMGVLGLFPSNALQIMKPVYSTVMWSALICLFVCFLGLFDKTRIPGNIEFSNWSWFGLLFTTGMGIGILNYAFQEAVMLSEYNDPVANPLGQVFNHWTLIPWGLYTAYVIFETYDMNYNLTPKWFKSIKTIIYAVAMMLGIGISFALGVIAISGAASHIYGVNIPSYALVILLGLLVTVSILRGMHKGLKVFSNIAMTAMYGYIILLMFELNSDFLPMMTEGLKSFVVDFGYNNIFHDSQLQIDWTVYYVIWFYSWVPFVTPFAIQASKGRTLRSVVTALVIMPSLLITLFMSIGTNIGWNLYESGVDTSVLQFEAINSNWYLPIMFVFLMIAFYVTSSDSQSLALDSLISKGSKTKLVYRKIGWVLLEMAFVTVLLLAGSGTINAFLGLSLLFVPLLIVIGAIFIIYIVKFKIQNR